MDAFDHDTLNEMDRRIGLHLKTLRHVKNLTMYQTASFVGVSTAQLHKYETGKNRISAARLYAFCQLFEVDVSEFWDASA